jgi:hypothetical protein
MRTVKYFEYEKDETDPKGRFEKIEKGRALFHQFGVDYEEFESGPGNFSTAIIETPSGKVKNVPADMIEFIFPQT